MSVHTAGQPLECFVNQIVLHKSPLLDERGNPQLDENGKPRYLCGFHIAGGIDQDNTKSPQGYSDKGVYVTRVNEGSAAENAGLRPNDKILQVNGHDMTMVTHKKAVDYITRKPVLEMFVYRPADKIDSPQQSNYRVDDLENQMNKINARNNSGQQDFERNHNYKYGPGPHEPQSTTRNKYFDDTPISQGVPGVEGDYIGKYGDDRQNRQDGYHAQQQKYPQQTREWGDGQNLDNQKQQNPLKPPRWQQFPPAEQQTPREQQISYHQQTPRDFNPEQNKSQQMPQSRDYNTGRNEQNQKTYENQIGRSNLNDYRKEPQFFNPGGPSHSAYQAQHHRNSGEERNPNSQQSSLYVQQQRSYGVGQQRTSEYIPDKRSTQPYNSNYPSQKPY